MLCISVYCILFVVWTVADGVLKWGYRTTSNISSSVFYGDNLDITFAHNQDKQTSKKFDTVIDITAQKNNLTVPLVMNQQSLTTFYMPVAVYLSLLIASPVEVKRKTKALLPAVFLLLPLLLFRIHVPVILQLSQVITIPDQNGTIHNFQAIELSPGISSILSHLQIVFVHSASSFFVVPIVVWVLTTFRKDDIKLIQAS